MPQRVVVVYKQPQHAILRCSRFSNATTSFCRFFPLNERFRSLSVTHTPNLITNKAATYYYYYYYYYLSHKIKKKEMGRAYGTYGKQETYVQVFDGKTYGKAAT